MMKIFLFGSVESLSTGCETNMSQSSCIICCERCERGTCLSFSQTGLGHMMNRCWWRRSHSLINNDHKLCTTDLATVLIAVLIRLGLSYWHTWMYGLIELNWICARTCTRAFLINVSWLKKKKFSFPADEEPAGVSAHGRGAARFSCLLQCKRWCCPWCWNTLL